MPYLLDQVKPNGFFVTDKSGKRFSKKPLSKKMALKQRIAIAISEANKTHKPIEKFFD
jgi:hypothetical protein